VLIGDRFGSYEVLGRIGEGGMGEVYRARDSSLGRDVAIKVLPSRFAADPERLARFEREARTLAALNHSNIAAIYGLARAGAASVLVMELAEGDTLAARIACGRLAADEAIAIAHQIAAALEAAHEKGIVHRDLKPANIVVSRGDRVKVLDFGLAKLAAATDSDSAPFNAANSPTIAASLAGTILGTAAYMSPEQARGKAVDKRADIWAFGCVLFEMLSGQPAFSGETLTDVVAAVVTKEPDWTALPAETPSHVISILRRCLQKDPGRRIHDVADARIELLESVADRLATTPIPPRRNPWMQLAFVVLAGGAIAAALVWGVARTRFAPPQQAASVARLELDLPLNVDLYGGNAPGVSLSPDGKRIAFVGVLAGQRHIYTRNLDSYEAVPLRGTEQSQAFFFSPDGGTLGFITPDRILKRVSLSDGLVVVVARDADQYSGAVWGRDGRITFSREGALYQVAGSGGPIAKLTSLDTRTSELLHTWPEMLPHGKALLFASLSGDDVKTSRVEALRLATGERHEIVTGTFPRYAESGHLVFFRGKDLLAAPFDADRLELTGPAVRVLENIGLDFNGVPLASFSPSGTLAYVPVGTGTSRLVWVSREGVEQPITDSTARYQSPRLAPDGRRIAVHMGGSLWIHDSVRRTFTRTTSDDAVGSGFTAWDPDGKRVAFRSRTGMRSIEVDSGKRSLPLQGSTGIRDIPNSVSPDRDTLAFTRQDGETSGDIYVASLSDRFPPRPVVRTPAYEGGAQFSPDGRWLAYASNESGRFEVYVRPYDESQRRFAVSSDGGSYPLWRRDGAELFYRSGNKMMAVSVSARGSDVTLSTPRMLFDRRYGFETSTIANYDVSLDGTRFLMVKDEVGAGRVNIVLNWFEELKRLAPTRP